MTVMVHILTPLVFEDDTADLDEYELRESYDIIWRDRFLRCPAGMTTDGGSIPRWLWRVVGNPWQRPLVRGFVPHDGGYRGKLVDQHGNPVYLSKEDCDLMLWEVGRFVYVPSDRWYESVRKASYMTKVQAVYDGVHWCGAGNYHGAPPDIPAVSVGVRFTE